MLPSSEMYERSNFDASISAGSSSIEIAHLDDVRVPEQRVGIEVELGVERDDFAVAGDHERIDLGQRCVGLDERLVESLQHRPCLRDAGLGNADLARHIVGLGVGQAGGRVDEHLVDLFRRGRGDVLDIHAALGARHERDSLRAAIDHHADIELLLDVGAFLDQQAAHLLASRPGLMRDELHTENLAGALLHFLERLGDLDAASLAAAARMDLRLHHPHRAAQRLGGLHRFVDGKRGNAARNRDPVLAEDFLALIFVNFHSRLTS